MGKCCQIVATKRLRQSKILDLQGVPPSLQSFQLHRGGGLGGDVVEDAVDALDLVHDAAGDGVEQLPRQTRKVGGHEVLCLYRAQRDGVVIGALVAHDADRAQVCERGEILVDAALEARPGDLLAEDGVRLRSMDNCLMKNIASSLFCDNSVMTAVIGIRQTNEGSNAQAAVT